MISPLVAKNKELAPLQPVSQWLLRLFNIYTGYYIRRHFQGLHLLNSSNARSLDGWPLLVCMNHPSWWDPLLGIFLTQRFFRNRKHFSPIAVEGLNKYRFFQKFGFFGIDPKSRTGAARFLQVGRTVLAWPNAALWVTVQGQFTDVRVRPLQLQAGVAHLAHATKRFAMLPIALEYSFWLERKPEAFAHIGQPIFIEDGSSETSTEWLARFTAALDATQTLLSDQVKARNIQAFEAVFQGKSGVGGVYDLWRGLKSTLQSESRTRLS